MLKYWYRSRTSNCNLEIQIQMQLSTAIKIKEHKNINCTYRGDNFCQLFSNKSFAIDSLPYLSFLGIYPELDIFNDNLEQCG